MTKATIRLNDIQALRLLLHRRVRKIIICWESVYHKRKLIFLNDHIFVSLVHFDDAPVRDQYQAMILHGDDDLFVENVVYHSDYLDTEFHEQAYVEV